MSHPSPKGRLVALAALAALLMAHFGATARAQEAAAGSLTLIEASPWVEADGTISLTVATEGDVGATVMRVRIHSPVRTVGALDEALEGDAGRGLYTSPPIPVGFLPVAADGTREVQITASTSTSGDLTARLRNPGVHPLTLTLEQPDGTVLTTVRTAFTRLGTDDDPLAVPNLAMIFAIAADPTVGADGLRTLESADIDRLGRVGEAIAALTAATEQAGTSAPISIAAIPDTLDALSASTDPRAQSLVEAVAALGDDDTALGLPYVALSAQALVDAELDAFLPALVSLGRGALDDRLEAVVDETFWPTDDEVDPSGAEALAAIGVRHLLVPAPADPVAAPVGPLVDAGPRPIEGLEPLGAVTVDTATSEALAAAAPDRFDAGTLALARLILRTPSDADDAAPTVVVVSVDDVPADSNLSALLPLLALPGSPVTTGGLELVGTGPVLDAAPFVFSPRDPDDGSGVDGDQSLEAIAPRVREVDAVVDTFAATVEGESARAVDLRLRVATALARGLSPEDRRALLDAADSAARETFDAISLAGQTDLNLTSRSGTLPLVLRNDTGFPVRVVVGIRSERLQFPQGDRFEMVLTDELTRLDVPVEARATGSVPTFVTVSTPDDEIRLDSRQLNVRSTAISGVGLTLSLGALAVLVIWWVRSWRRARHGDVPVG